MSERVLAQSELDNLIDEHKTKPWNRDGVASSADLLALLELRSLRARLAEVERELEEARAAINAIRPVPCSDCDGDGFTARSHPNTPHYVSHSCESCGGNEDRRGDGYHENPDVTYAEWLDLEAVRAALAAEREAKERKP